MAPACQDFRRSILEGDSPGDHAANCLACREFADGIASLSRTVASALAVAVDEADVVSARARVLKEVAGMRGRRVSRLAWGGIGALAASLFVAIGAGLLTGSGPNVGPPATSAAGRTEAQVPVDVIKTENGVKLRWSGESDREYVVARCSFRSGRIDCARTFRTRGTTWVDDQPAADTSDDIVIYRVQPVS